MVSMYIKLFLCNFVLKNSSNKEEVSSKKTPSFHNLTKEKINFPFKKISLIAKFVYSLPNPFFLQRETPFLDLSKKTLSS